MQDTLILTDSNSGILQQEGRDQGIYVIPMPFTVNGEEYLEEISMSQEQFFDALQNDADVKTSQPSEFYLEDLWTTLLKDYKDIIYIPMSGGLSATCANAKTYAEKFDGRVHVVDNKRISITQKLSVLEANAMVKRGVPVREILELSRQNQVQSVHLPHGKRAEISQKGRPSVTRGGSNRRYAQNKADTLHPRRQFRKICDDRLDGTGAQKNAQTAAGRAGRRICGRIQTGQNGVFDSAHRHSQRSGAHKGRNRTRIPRHESAVCRQFVAERRLPHRTGRSRYRLNVQRTGYLKRRNIKLLFAYYLIKPKIR